MIHQLFTANALKQITIVSGLFFAVNIVAQRQKTQVLILGTPHLQQMEGVTEKHIYRLIDSLKPYHFDAVAVEKMPAELLLDIKARPASHWKDLYEGFKGYIVMGETYQQKLQMSYTAALEKIDSLQSLQILTDADRLAYIKAYLCSYDPWSAGLHYTMLADKRSLDSTMINTVFKFTHSKNEINLIGLSVARFSKLRKIDYIDNLQDETLLLKEFPAFIKEYTANQDKINKTINDDPIFKKSKHIETEAMAKGDLYSLYKFFNSEAYMKGDFKGQWALWLQTGFSSKSDRSRYALWEMRNLSITANIMRTAAAHPGGRILVIIGASHKSFLEKYLRQIADIEVLPF